MQAQRCITLCSYGCTSMFCVQCREHAHAVVMKGLLVLFFPARTNAMQIHVLNPVGLPSLYNRGVSLTEYSATRCQSCEVWCPQSNAVKGVTCATRKDAISAQTASVAHDLSISSNCTNCSLISQLVIFRFSQSVLPSICKHDSSARIRCKFESVYE